MLMLLVTAELFLTDIIQHMINVLLIVSQDGKQQKGQMGVTKVSGRVSL